MIWKKKQEELGSGVHLGLLVKIPLKICRLSKNPEGDEGRKQEESV